MQLLISIEVACFSLPAANFLVIFCREINIPELTTRWTILMPLQFPRREYREFVRFGAPGDASRHAAERASVRPNGASLKISGIFPRGDKSVISDFYAFGCSSCTAPLYCNGNNAKLIMAGLEIRATELHIGPILHTFLRVPANKYRVRSLQNFIH